MSTVTVIVTLLLAAALVGSGVGKLRQVPTVMVNMDAAGVPRDKVPYLAYIEFAAAVGLVIGLAWAPLGILAGICSAVYFALAVAAHLRRSDRNIGPAVGYLVLSVAATVLLIAN